MYKQIKVVYSCVAAIYVANVANELKSNTQYMLLEIKTLSMNNLIRELV